MKLKENQWYQLPSGEWVQAICVNDPIGPILQAYGYDGASRTRYTNTFDIYVAADGHTLGVTGLCTWDTWTLADLREATPDEAETQTYRSLNIPQLTHRESSDTDEETMPKRYRIYYARQTPDLKTPPATRATLAQTHVLVHKLDADSLGEVYMRMQAEAWASEADLLAFGDHVYSLGSFHTTMCAGDVVENTINGTFHLCDFFGWRELE